MKPVPFEGMNRIYTPPKNWDVATMGVCRDLPVREENGGITSCYEFDSDDWRCIKRGARLYFTIYTPVQPVVSWQIKP